MDIKIAAENTRNLIDDTPLLPEAADPDGPESYQQPWCKAHLHVMCRKIQEGEVTGEKAHRWLGWVQACICMGSGATLDELKNINHKA